MTSDPAGASSITDEIRAQLRTPTFRRLTVAWWGTNVADSILVLILAVWVLDLTGSPAAGGATFAALGVPALAAPFLGQLADRVSRRRMLVVVYLLGAAVLLPLFAVHDAGQVWLVYLVTLAYAAAAYATGAAQSGLLRDMFTDDAIGHANSRLSVIDQVCRIVMPVVGAAIYAVIGPFPLVGIAIAGFVLAMVIMTRLTVTETPPATERAPMATELVAGFAHLWRARPLRELTTAITVAVAVTGLFNGYVFVILDGFGLPPEMLGPVSVVQGVFGLRVVAVGLAVMGSGVALLAGTWLPLAFVGMALIGLGVTAAVVAYITERQVATPARLQGRTATAAMLVLNFPQVPFTLVGAALVTVLDRGIAVLGTAAVCLVAGLAALLIRPPAATPDVPASDPDMLAAGEPG
ncbi:MAG: MFS transporter [Propionicimonas sp.]|nr:MFS transporter [Propionicimonas sp.]